MGESIAIVDDEKRMVQILKMILRKEGYVVSGFTDPEAFAQTLETQSYDLILTDLRMPKIGGVELLERIKGAQPDTPVILITAHGSIQTAIEAIKIGAFDYVEKPFDNDALKILIQKALKITRLARENRQLRAALNEKYQRDGIICQSEAMASVLNLAQRAARSRATVLITGESGTGKEVIAKAIHHYSDRFAKPFVAINLKALSPGILEAELFGYKKGAYTGATRNQRGVFERAHGGTLFLDELGEIDGNLQVKLLRVLQEREIQPVGSEETIKIDVRILAATNRNLEEAVANGAFREDLYYRLAVIPIHLPPLRERRADILPLARHFLLRWARELNRPHCQWTAEVENHLLQYDWPGNVRELENAMERAMVLAEGTTISHDDLLLPPTKDAAPNSEHLKDFLDQATRGHIIDVLKGVGGKRTEAARKLGVERTTLYRLMKRLNIDA